MRWWAKPKRLSGGVFFTATKEATIDVPIKTLSARETLRVPLWVPDHFAEMAPPSSDRLEGRSHGEAEPQMELLVKTGECVEAGRLLARPRSDEPRWARVYAPVAGVIGNRVTVESPLGFPVSAVELKANEDESAGGTSVTATVKDLSEDVLDRLAILGIGVGDVDTLSDAPPAGGGLDRIIVDGLESAPYATARTRTLVENSRELIDAVARLAEDVPAREVYFVVDRGLNGLVNTLRRQARNTPVQIIPLPNKYPQCHPRMLFRAVTRCDVSLGLRSAEKPAPQCEPSTWIIGTCTLLDIHRALTRGCPPVTQTLTIAGDAIQRPGNYRVPVGMSVAAILRRVGLRGAPARVVLGNALAGVAIRSAERVIVRGIEGLYAWSASAVPDLDPTGCLRCGFCIEVCPARIDPVGVFNAVELGWATQSSGERVLHPVRAATVRERSTYCVPHLLRSAEHELSWSPLACIDCGLCDYVCPAALPLMGAVRSARAHIEGGR